VVVPGDTLLLKGQALFYCISRPLELLPLRYFKPNAVGAYGEADRYGIIGEGEAIWRVREELAFHAELDEHVLVLGPSGTGKELAARAIHAMSRRANGPFVACSAANFPSGLVEAELFGNAKNYPNPGTPARKGLVGEAEHGTLFLDEIGELPHTLQAHLLRMLDTHGEYHRLGEAQIQRADIRVIAATNRDPSELKHDLAARLKLRATMPPLDARREDIPLLLRARMRRLASDTPSIGVRFMGDRGEPRLDPALVDTLLRSTYSTGVRELERILFAALSASPGDRIMLSSELRTEIPQAPRARFAPAPTDEQVRESLERHGDNVTRAAQELGVSRFSLHRLIKKLK